MTSGGESSSSSAFRFPFFAPIGVLVASGDPNGLGTVSERCIPGGRSADLRTAAVTGVGEDGM